ncbi:MAG: TIGR04219 family outer membrane beta-barrel protein [Campylobacterota bacterium]|nr:TIGR04219 family outer membrane beta-barrel protein [Campylobacterota bacterium]
MNKILTSLVSGAILTSSLCADFARIEMGAGSLVQTPVGSVTTTDDSNFLSLDGTYTTNGDESAQMYAWMLVKHPVPIIPNLRVEYLSITDAGNFTYKMEGVSSPTTEGVSSPTTVDMKQFDIIPYYNLLDNTFWVTVDAGIDIKVIQADINIQAIDAYMLDPMVPSYLSSDTVAIPLLYLRGRVQIPTTNIGLESDVKYISDGDNTVYDIRAKVDYTFDIFPIIQPAFELGYRIQKFDIDTDETVGALEYSGVYAGMMIRF